MNNKLKCLAVFVLALIMIILSLPSQAFATEEQAVVAEENQLENQVHTVSNLNDTSSTDIMGNELQSEKDQEHLNDLIKFLNGRRPKSSRKIHEVVDSGENALITHFNAEVEVWYKAYFETENISPVTFKFTPIDGNNFSISEQGEITKKFDPENTAETEIIETINNVYFTVTVGEISEETHQHIEISWSKPVVPEEPEPDPEPRPEPEQDPVDVQKYLEENFTLSTIKYWKTDNFLKDTEIDWHLQMPTNLLSESYATGKGGLTLEQYNWLNDNFGRTIFSSSDDSVLTFKLPSGISAYRGKIFRPLPGESAKPVKITVSLTHKEDPTKKFTSSLDLTVLPFSQNELEQAVSLMNASKSAFAEALLGENPSTKEVTKNLKTFYEMRFDSEGDLFIARTSAQKTNLGVEIDSDILGKIESSRTDIIPGHNLEVWPQEYNQDVTLKTNLTHYLFKDIAIALTDGSLKPSPEGKAAAEVILNQLYRVPVEATYKVVGTTGEDDPDALQSISASLIVEGSKILETQEDKFKDNHEIWFNSGKLEITQGTSIIEFVDSTVKSSDKYVSMDLNTTSGWLTSIEFENYPMNKTGETNGTASSWMWYVKAKGADDFIMVPTLDIGDAEAYIKDGDIIKLKFINDPRYPYNVAPQKPEQPIELKDDDVVGWTGFRGDAQNKTPVREVETIPEIIREQIWDSINTNINEWGYPSTISDLLSINDKVYYATEKKLIRLNEQGEIDAEVDLAGSIEFFSRLTYSNGMIIIPVQGGGVQAIDPFTMTSLWVVGSIDSIEKWEQDDTDEWVQNFYPVQSLGTPLVDNGIVYVPITAPKFPDTAGGVIRAIDMSTGEEIWRYNNLMEAGFYWGGATKIGDYLIIGDDSGILHAISTIDRENKGYGFDTYGSKIRSTMVSQDDMLYFTTTDGTFHSIKFNPDSGSKFSDHKSVKFAGASTSTPTIYNGKAYVGGQGGAGGWGAPGAFAVIDLASMAVEYSSEDIIGEVKSAPLVLHDTNGVYAYFTGNSEQGLLYVYHAGKVELAYRPSHDQAQYTTATPIVDQNGNIYYTTDAAVIALRSRIDSQLNEFELKVISSIGDATFELADDPELLKHSSLHITDATNGIKLLYGEDIEKELGKIDYAAFRTKFEGQAEENPSITIKLIVDQEYLPLTENQEYKLYKLVGSQLIEVGLNNPSAKTGRVMSIMPMLLSQLNNQLFQTSAANRTISFNQLLKDNSTYVLAATNVVAPTPEEPTDPEKPVEPEQPTDPVTTTEPDKPEQEASQPAGGQVTEKETVQAKADTAQTSTTSTSQVQQLARTGEQILIIPGIVSIMVAVVLILVKKISRYSEKTE